MTPLESALRRAFDEIEALGRRAALIGGLAVSVRAQPRLTVMPIWQSPSKGMLTPRT